MTIMSDLGSNDHGKHYKERDKLIYSLCHWERWT